MTTPNNAMLTSNNDRKPVISLATQFRRQLIMLGAVIFVGLVILVTVFSFYQIEQATNSYMRLEAVKLEHALKSDPSFPLPRQAELSAYRQWGEIPDKLRLLFAEQDVESGSPIEAERYSENGTREYVYLMYSDTLDSGGLFLIEVEQADNIDALIQSIAEQTVVDATLITGAFILAFFLIIAYMFHNALRPLNLLVDWSKQIKEQPENDILVNFSISELNDIAQHLLASLKQVKDYNEREQQFLKHASHELRTPLTIIQASLDSLGVRIPSDNPGLASLNRARRASHNMVVLTEALLWLARESNRPVQKAAINPASLCEELITDMRYLIEDKPVEVNLNVTSDSMLVEKDLFRIVLANLIRNAFQHSSEGEISISISQNQLVVVNQVDHDSESSIESFGLGLQLVERISAKLMWQFSFLVEENTATVRLMCSQSNI